MSNHDTAKTNSKGAVDLLNGPIMRPLVMFMIPLFLSNALQQIYNAVDTAIVGHYLGETSLAAVGAVSSIFDLLVYFMNGIGVGSAIVTARFYGMGNTEKLKKSVAGALEVGAVTVAGLTIASAFFMKGLMTLINTPDAVFNEAYSYIHVISMYLVVMYVYNLLAALLRAIGNSFVPLMFLLFSSVLNIFLDIFCITSLQMGVRGAAVATVISQVVSAVLCFLYILAKVRILIPAGRHFRPDAALLKEIAGQSYSMGFMSSIVCIGTVILQSGINSLGEFVISGHVAARKIFNLFTLPLFSMAQASATFVSQNFGAGKIGRVKEGTRDVWLFSVVVGAIDVVLLGFLARPAMYLISGSTNEIILGNGTVYLHFASYFFWILGILVCTRNILQGLGLKVVPLISSAIELVGKIVFTWVFVPKYGYDAVILCEPLIWCVMTAQLVWTYRKRMRKIGNDSGIRLSGVKQ